jgi:type VI secretion system protein ImpE
MSSLQLLRAGNVSEVLKSLQNDVRNNPSEPKHRIFLFQVYCVIGSWDRALNQLNVLRDLEKTAVAMADTYQELLACEALRAEVFQGKRSPLLFGEPEPWAALMLESLKHLGNNEIAAARELRDKAFEDAPAVGGTLSLFPVKQEGTEHEGSNLHTQIEFQWISDADSRIGPFLEAIINGRYFWVPFHRIQTIAIEKVSDLRDLVWLPSRFTWTNGGECVGFVPTRYAGSEAAADDSLKLGHKTIWEDLGSETYAGLGQRTITTDVDEYGIAEISKITLNHG